MGRSWISSVLGSTTAAAVFRDFGTDVRNRCKAAVWFGSLSARFGR
jgi:hypothetical protein